MTRRLLLLPVLATLCGCSVLGDTPRAGLWETTTEVVGMADLGLPPADLAKLQQMTSGSDVARECFDGQEPRVGQPKMGGQCKVTRAADTGTTVDREWRCPAAAGRRARIITFAGTRGAEAYDFRITAREASPGRKDAVIVTRERGRRIGDCPAKP